MVYCCRLDRKTPRIIELMYVVFWFNNRLVVFGLIPHEHLQKVQLAHHNSEGDVQLDGTCKLKVGFNVERDWDFDDTENRAEIYRTHLERRTGLPFSIERGDETQFQHLLL